MAGLDNFDANTVDPLGDYSPIPEGWYLASIVSSEKKNTKSGTGAYLECKMAIVQGDHKGRNVWVRLNLWNPNQQAVGIARSELSSICRAVGVMQPKDSQQLHNIPLAIHVKVKKREDNGEMTNEIKDYKSRAELAKPEGAQAPSGPAPWAPNQGGQGDD